MKKTILLSVAIYSTLFGLDIDNLKSFESNFKQSIVNEQNSRIVYSGKIYATKNSNQALWEYKNPIEKKIYYKGGDIVIIEPELEQAIFAKLTKVPNILQLLENSKRVSKNQLSTTFNKIKYTIFTSENMIKKIVYTDEIHNRVTIEFSNQLINRDISKSRFVYNIPDEYDILKQ